MKPSEDDASSLYAALNVRRDATESEIKKSYRQLAQLYHPDKHTDPALKARAEVSFTRMQEAYEVLSNESKRSVYDVYGRQGLEAGLSVVPHSSDSQEALRRNWQRFQEQEAESRMQAHVSHRGHYVVRVDATNILDPYDASVSRTPELVSIIMQDNVQIPVSSDTTATLGCQAGVRKGLGFGAFICGVRRELTPHTSADAQAVIGGLKSLLTVSSTQRFGENASATVAATVSYPSGIGMQVSTHRRLSTRWEGEAGAVMGLGGIASTSLSLTYRAERFLALAKVEAGLQAGIMVRCQWSVADGTVARMTARAGLTAVGIEIGFSHRLADFSTAGCSVATGVQGITLKPHYSRGSHTFEVPIVLSTIYKDPTALLVAHLLPPVVSLGMHFFLLKPLRKHLKVKEALQHRQAAVRDVRKALAIAEGDNLLMAPVAKRQLEREAAKGGLVIVDARYGDLNAILQDYQQRTVRQNSSQEASTSSSSSPIASHEGQGFETSMDLDEDPEVSAAVEAALASQQPLPPWADVTTAVRYLIRDGKVAFHSGLSKRGLMGFCDACPSTEKALYVLYYYRHKPHFAAFLDLEGGEMPSHEHALSKPDVVALIEALAAAQGIMINNVREDNGVHDTNGFHSVSDGSPP